MHNHTYKHMIQEYRQVHSSKPLGAPLVEEVEVLSMELAKVSALKDPLEAQKVDG